MKKKNAFTLIELLAIIVILAIIAVITVPIILNVIENSKRGAVIDSAYGYRDAVQKYYLSKTVTNPDQELPTATYDITELPSDFTVSGEAPSEGWVELENGQVVAYSLKFDNYVVTKDRDSEPIATKTGEPTPINNNSSGNGGSSNNNGGSTPSVIDTTGMTLGIKVGNVQYYTGGTDVDGEEPDNAVYFDPINGTYNCTTYHEDNSITGFNGVVTGTGSTKTTDNQTTCLKWFVYSIDDKGTESESDDVVNMILDHNTTGGIAWNDTNGSSSKNYTGPNSAFLTQLTNDTSAWTSNKLISPSAYTASWTDSNSTARTYTITYTTKVRLIEADEVAKIKGDSSWIYTSTSSSYIDTNNYNFLKVNLSTSGDTNRGYWTSSPYARGSISAWTVSYSARLGNSNVYGAGGGVRPVVSLLKSDVL